MTHDEIDRIAQDIVDYYGELLQWAEGLRVDSRPERLRSLR